MEISPPSQASFDQCHLLIPKEETLRVTNRQRSRTLEVKTILASSPELTLFLPNGVSAFPVRLRPGESLEVKVGFASETLGLFEAVVYIVIDEWVYMVSFNAYVVPNPYDITPFYVTDLVVNQTMEIPLFIKNPSPTDTLIIEELYSTEEDVKL